MVSFSLSNSISFFSFSLPKPNHFVCLDMQKLRICNPMGTIFYL